MIRTLFRAAVIALVLALAIQLVPVTRDNPPATGAIDAPPAIQATLKRACFDCHSNETVWPWYSRIAPASWLVAHDVHEGREHVNFSTWGSLPADRRQKAFREIVETVERGQMPPGIYTPLHPEARLSLQEINALVAWARKAGEQPQASAAAPAMPEPAAH